MNHQHKATTAIDLYDQPGRVAARPATIPIYPEIIGESSELQQTLRLVSRVAPTDSTVLILGETGTGKELVARAIHNDSSRKAKPMVKVNCATLPANLIESEIFGHERGSFTGAEMLTQLYLGARKQNGPTRRSENEFVAKTIEENERDHILDMLRYCKGRVAGYKGAARILGIPASTLSSKLKRLGIQKGHYSYK